MNRVILLSFLLTSNSLFSQLTDGINVHIIREAITIDFDKLDDQSKLNNKTKVLIFEKFDSTRNKNGQILKFIKSNNLKFDERLYQIDLYYFHHDSGVQVCKLEKEITFKINGIKGDILHKLPVIYIYGNNDSLNNIIKNFHFETVNLKPNFFYLNKFDEITRFLKHIPPPPDLIILYKDLAKKIKLLEHEILKLKIDTLKSKIWNINYSQKSYTKTLTKSNIELKSKIQALNSLEISKTNFSIGKNKNIGFKSGFTYRTLKILTESENIVDCLDNNYTDPTGDNFIKILYGHGLKDLTIFNLLGFKLGLCFKTKQLLKNSYLSITPNIEINSLINSNYQAQSGEISIGGIYPQYNKKDTMFNNLYGFSQNNLVYKEKINFIGKPTSFVYNVDFNFAYAPFTNKLIVQIGANLSYSSNIINKYSDKDNLSENINDYNALLYRAQSLKYFAICINFGLSYKL